MSEHQIAELLFVIGFLASIGIVLGLFHLLRQRQERAIFKYERELQRKLQDKEID